MYFYIHIPFCRRKCPYCSFASFSRGPEEMDRYFDALKIEIGEYFSRVQNVEVESIYFGGGTPSLFGAERIARLIELFRNKGNFKTSPEITIECNPEDIQVDFITTLRQAGVSRISVGIQSLHDPTLHYCGRATNEVIESALQCLDTMKFPNVSIDWIIGLPHETSTLAHIRSTLECHTIHHMSVYMLEKNSIRNHSSENQEMVVREYEAIRHYLDQKGFWAYEISNFALPGFECKHNQAYWTHKPYHGFGLSAASYWAWIRRENATTFAAYYAGEKTTETLTDEQLRLEKIMFSIRTREGCPIELIRNTSTIDELKRSGLIRQEWNVIFPTLSWIFILDHIIASVA